MLFLRKTLGKALDRLFSLAIFLNLSRIFSCPDSLEHLRVAVPLVARGVYYHYRKGQESVYLALKRRLAAGLCERGVDPDGLIAVLRSELSVLPTLPSPWLKRLWAEEGRKGQEDTLQIIWAYLATDCLDFSDPKTFRAILIRRAKSYARAYHLSLLAVPFMVTAKVPS